jgi:hypothetical protein
LVIVGKALTSFRGLPCSSPTRTQAMTAACRTARAEGTEYNSLFWTKYLLAHFEFGKTALFVEPSSCPRRPTRDGRQPDGRRYSATGKRIGGSPCEYS